ncbi:MAG: hypothetical protein ACXAC0_03265 [Candidatus Thorarchaeota archaeon]|jgi:hypothetical protein
MSETDTILIENQERNEARQPSGLKRVLNVIGLALVWAVLSAAIVGSLAAAIWTVIPTEILQWGASEVNLIGYVSHCSYTPISTLILLSTAVVGTVISYKLHQGRTIGLMIFAGTSGGLMIGLLGGIDVTMYIGMGAGLGVGVFLGLVIGLVGKRGV